MFRLFSGITLSKEELQSIEHVVTQLRHACILLQDLYSWDGGYCSQNAKDTNSECAISSSIARSMRDANLSASGAISQIKNQVRKCEEDYLALKERFLSEKPNCSPEIRQSFKFLELLQAGTCLWSATSKTSALRRVCCRLHRPTFTQPLIVAQFLDPTFSPPRKGVRHLIFEALDIWYAVPPKILSPILEITILLRNIVRRSVNRS
jgi:hypothetical protein